MFYRKKIDNRRGTKVHHSNLFFRFEIERISKLEVDPANFKDFLYQPEKEAQTGESIHQREDHNHLLKRILASLREGSIPGIDLRFMCDNLCRIVRELFQWE